MHCSSVNRDFAGYERDLAAVDNNGDIVRAKSVYIQLENSNGMVYRAENDIFRDIDRYI